MFMKQRMLIGLCVSFICLSPQLMAEKRAQKVIVKKSDIVKKTIGVKGMTCVGCEVTLERSMKKVHGVVAVKASASDENAIIAYDKSKIDEATVRQMIENFGYKPFKIVEEK